MTPKRWTIAIILTVAAATVGLTAALSGSGRRMLTMRVRAELERALPCPFTVRDIRVGLLRGVELRDLKLMDDTAAREQIFSARSVRLHVGLSGFFRKATPFREISIQRASIMLERDAAHRVNFVELMNQIEAKNPGGAPIPRIVMNDVRVDWLDYASSTIPAHGMARIRYANIRNTGDGFTIEKSKVEFGDSVVVAKGVWPSTIGKPVNIDIRISPLRAADMVRLARLAIRPKRLPAMFIDGDGSFEGAVYGVRGAERVDGALNMNGGRLGDRKMRRARIRFSSNKSGDIELRECSVRMDNGGLLLSDGTLRPRAPWTFALNATAREFPVEALFGVVFKPASLSGIADGHFALVGNPADTATYRGDGHVEIREGAIPNSRHRYERPTAFHLIQADFKIGDGRIRVEDGRMENDDMKLEIGGTVGFDRTLRLGGKCSVRKESARKGFFRKILSTALPDDAFGYRFPVRIDGTFAEPNIGIKTARTLTNGVQDRVRDAGNKIEKFFKDRF